MKLIKYNHAMRGYIFGGKYMKEQDLELQIEQLKTLRKDTGLSRKEFAMALGIPLRTMEDWEVGRRKMPEYVLRLITYWVKIEMVSKAPVQKNVSIIKDEQGKSIVIVNDIRFKGKQNINWEEVEAFVKEYVGDCYEIVETADKIYIGTDFPSEIKGSIDTAKLKGANAKAKANATQKIPLLLEYATNKRWKENKKEKHVIDAVFGWYRYTSRFALPVYTNNGELERYNIFRIEMLVRHASDGRMYLYDMVNVKKETEYPA